MSANITQGRRNAEPTAGIRTHMRPSRSDVEGRSGSIHEFASPLNVNRSPRTSTIRCRTTVSKDGLR